MIRMCFIVASFAAILVGVSPTSLFGDDCACEACCSGLVNYMSNECQNACSSNCVKMTPESCSQLKADLSAALYDIEDKVTNFNILATSLSYQFGALTGYLGQVESHINGALSALSSYSDVSFDLASIYNSFETAETRLSTVQNALANNVALRQLYSVAYGGSAYATNTTTHASYRLAISFLHNIYTMTNAIRTAREYVHTAYTELQHQVDANEYALTSNSVFVSSAISALRMALDPLGYAVRDIQIFAGALNLFQEDVSVETENIHGTIQMLGARVDEIDCAPCGNGSGGGYGGGGNTTVDFSPVVVAIDSLREQLDYWMARLLTMISNLFSDYDSARSVTYSGRATYSGYRNVGENWFARIEYLLYAISDLNSENDAPPTPDDSAFTEVQNTYNNAKSDSESDGEQVEESLRGGWNGLRENLQRLLDALKFQVKTPESLGGKSFVDITYRGVHFVGKFPEQVAWLYEPFSWLRRVCKLGYYLLFFASGFCVLWFTVSWLQSVAQWYISLWQSFFG